MVICTELRVLRINDLAEKLSIGKSTIYDWLNKKSPRYDASFPRPIKLGGNSQGWLSSLIDQWLINKYKEEHDIDIELVQPDASKA